MSACKDGSTLEKIHRTESGVTSQDRERVAALKATRFGDTTPYSAPPREATANAVTLVFTPEGERTDEWVVGWENQPFVFPRPVTALHCRCSLVATAVRSQTGCLLRVPTVGN